MLTTLTMHGETIHAEVLKEFTDEDGRTWQKLAVARPTPEMKPPSYHQIGEIIYRQVQEGP